MKKLDQWFEEYGESHQNPVNKNIHWVCVPLIFYSILGLLASIPPDSVLPLFPEHWEYWAHWGTLAVVLGLVFYIIRSLTMAIGIALFSFLCLSIIAYVDQSAVSLWKSSLIIFILAWIGQFIGHKIEGKKPSFIKDIEFLLIGPAWLLHFLYKKWGIRY